MALCYRKRQIFRLSFGILNFNCSANCIGHFKARHNIVEKNCRWILVWWSKFYNRLIDDCVTVYKLMQGIILKFRGENCSGGKLSKDTITVMADANLSDTEKKKLLVRRKSHKPRCFSSVKTLPVDYVNNRKSWMTSELFEKLLRHWHHDLKLTDLKSINSFR